MEANQPANMVVSAAPAPHARGLKIWKLLSAVGVNAILFVGGPYLLAWAGIIRPLSVQAYFVLGVTWVGLTLKLLFGDIVSDKFEYHKHGYDFCILTMGTALSLLSVLLLSNRPVLTQLTWAPLHQVLLNEQLEQIVLVTALFLISCVLSLITARISRAVNDPATRGKELLSGLNCVLGSSMFIAYLFLLIAKA